MRTVGGVGAQYWEQLRGNELLVPNDVDVSGFVEVERGTRGANRQEIDGLKPSVGGVPVARIGHESDAIVQPPRLKLVGAADGQRTDAHPSVAMIVDDSAWHDRQRLERAEVEEEGGGIL